MLQYRISTEDNPINPFDDYDKWLLWDEQYLGHCSSRLLARLTHDSDNFSEIDREKMKSDAIDAIINEGLLPAKVIKITREV